MVSDPSPAAADPYAVQRLSPEALERSLDETLERRPCTGAIWVFGYGSLMWNPGFAFVEKRLATVHGFHRQFRHWSRVNRGTPDKPGLVLTLEPGGSCRGIAFRLGKATLREALLTLWRREMALGSYRPVWLTCRADGESLCGLTFVVNRADRRSYTGPMPLEAMVPHLAGARGRYGSAAEYLFQTQSTLATFGVQDRHIEQLAARVRAALTR